MQLKFIIIYTIHNLTCLTFLRLHYMGYNYKYTTNHMAEYINLYLYLYYILIIN